MKKTTLFVVVMILLSTSFVSAGIFDWLAAIFGQEKEIDITPIDYDEVVDKTGLTDEEIIEQAKLISMNRVDGFNLTYSDGTLLEKKSNELIFSIEKNSIKFKVKADQKILMINQKEWGYEFAGSEEFISESGYYKKGNKLCSNDYEIIGGVVNGTWTPERKVYDCAQYPSQSKNISGNIVDKRKFNFINDTHVRIDFDKNYDPSKTVTTSSTFCTDNTCLDVIWDGLGIVLDINDTWKGNLTFAFTFSEGTGTTAINLVNPGTHDVSIDGTNGPKWIHFDDNPEECVSGYCLNDSGSNSDTSTIEGYASGNLFLQSMTILSTVNKKTTTTKLLSELFNAEIELNYGSSNGIIVTINSDSLFCNAGWLLATQTQIGFRWDGTTKSCFGDGSPIGSTDSQSAPQTLVKNLWVFMNDRFSNEHFDGSHDDMFFWENRSLTNDELSSFHIQGFREDEGNTTINWSFGSSGDQVDVSFVAEDTDEQSSLCFKVEQETSSPWRCENTTDISLSGSFSEVNITYMFNTTNSTKTPIFLSAFVNLESAAPVDSCTYGGSGNFDIDCSDNCIVSSSTNVGGNDISIIGEGTININADILQCGDVLIRGDGPSNKCIVNVNSARFCS